MTRYLLCFGALLLALSARAQLTIDITTTGGRQIPVAILPLAGETSQPQSVSEVVGADLARTGLFRLVNAVGVSPLPTEPSEVNFVDWQTRTAEALVIGKIDNLPDGRVEVRFRLFDVQKQAQLASYSYVVPPAQLRATAHRIADVIYERLTGDKGVFSTKITYVVKRGTRFELQVSDADGFNPQSVLASNEPILSPTWSPDGSRLAYVSFDQKKPIVVVQNLAQGTTKIVANFRGNNSAPAWSPDGKHLAVALSKDDITQVYRISANGGEAQRLTETNAIDTQPAFSPDGQWIAFTSDRGGTPQVYRMPASGGAAQRLTFEGTYNVGPRYSPDGKAIAFVQRENGRFRIALLELATGQVTALTEGTLDDSPSFAPNGKMILYEAQAGGRGQLAAVSSDGRVKQRLTSSAGDVRDPAWGPLPTN
ncbi:Tol-Pal system beta propeller repeat protein TolB [Usitatibacter palustris]|uniref:Tol-Pal system protein TolB n=1 Tax=Usitatibacter palustris TaxID=2732487 RepID=A0A6M4H4D3_9PROT|nr:Tol-Pal system beta propeller repeat protein TolB [Usitatibacter palustris]QJR14471.1 Tol-Pal system protein TolB [Usitatibacter palustris]